MTADRALPDPAADPADLQGQGTAVAWQAESYHFLQRWSCGVKGGWFPSMGAPWPPSAASAASAQKAGLLRAQPQRKGQFAQRAQVLCAQQPKGYQGNNAVSSPWLEIDQEASHLQNMPDRLILTRGKAVRSSHFHMELRSPLRTFK